MYIVYILANLWYLVWILFTLLQNSCLTLLEYWKNVNTEFKFLYRWILHINLHPINKKTYNSIYVVHRGEHEPVCIFFSLLAVLNKTNKFYSNIVCFGFLSHSRTFTHMETSSLPLKDCRFFYLHVYSALVVIEQCHTYCDMGNPFIMVFRGPMTLTPIAGCLAVEL